MRKSTDELARYESSIDGMQLTFMEIGREGLNPSNAYLSPWLGGHGARDTQMFINDGRPIIGVAGMWSRKRHSPAFCLGLVTIPVHSLADAPRVSGSPTRPGL